MDLLSKRYANPCFLLDGMMQTGRFAEFVDDFIKKINEETEHENKEKEMRFNWEFFLHRVFDKSFGDYLAEIENDKAHKNLSEDFIETTVQNSMDLLNSFNPEQGGE